MLGRAPFYLKKSCTFLTRRNVFSTECAAGTFSIAPAATSCVVCPTGTGDPSGLSGAVTSASCVACLPGTFSSSIGVCDACPKGSFQISGRRSSCELCSPGQFSAEIGAVTPPCRTCAAGHYSNVGSEYCPECVSGQYQPTSGAASCFTCTKDNSASGYLSGRVSCTQQPTPQPTSLPTQQPTPEPTKHCFKGKYFDFVLGSCGNLISLDCIVRYD